MSLNIDELAQQIVSLDRTEQEALVERVAELNFQQGLAVFSQKYQQRLAAEGKLDQQASEVLAELEQIREDIAAHDYQP